MKSKGKNKQQCYKITLMFSIEEAIESILHFSFVSFVPSGDSESPDVFDSRENSSSSFDFYPFPVSFCFFAPSTFDSGGAGIRKPEREGESQSRLGRRLGVMIAFAGDCIDTRLSCMWRMLQRLRW
jgi:hypothetical protein